MFCGCPWLVRSGERGAARQEQTKHFMLNVTSCVWPSYHWSQIVCQGQCVEDSAFCLVWEVTSSLCPQTLLTTDIAPHQQANHSAFGVSYVAVWGQVKSTSRPSVPSVAWGWRYGTRLLNQALPPLSKQSPLISHRAVTLAPQLAVTAVNQPCFDQAEQQQLNVHCCLFLLL